MLNACRLVMVTHRVLPLRGMASLHECFGKEQLVESYWGAGQSGGWNKYQ